MARKQVKKKARKGSKPFPGNVTYSGLESKRKSPDTATMDILSLCKKIQTSKRSWLATVFRVRLTNNGKTIKITIVDEKDKQVCWFRFRRGDTWSKDNMWGEAYGDWSRIEKFFEVICS